MKLHGKRLLMLVMDGVMYQEVRALQDGFEREYAEVFLSSPHDYLTVETVLDNKRGPDLPLDFPLVTVTPELFDGLIIPHGLLSTDLLKRESGVQELIRAFHALGLPLFASGEAVQLLYDSGVLSETILVRDASADLGGFILKAVDILLEGKKVSYSL